MLDFLFVFLGLVVVSGLIYGLATFVFGRGEEQAPMPPDVVPMQLPQDRALTGSDVRDVRLPVSVRGYRMSDVDELLDRLADELDRLGGPVALSRPEPPPADDVRAESDLESTGPVPVVPSEAPGPPDDPAEVGAAADEVARPPSAP